VVTVVLYALLAVLIGAALFLLAAFVLPAGEQIAAPLRDQAPWELPPDRALAAEDVETVRLPVALRGYRFAETDLLLDRLADEIRARDAEIGRLRVADSAGPGAASGPVPAIEPVQAPTPSPDAASADAEADLADAETASAEPAPDVGAAAAPSAEPHAG
jgi:hypothetical protein